MRAFLQRRRGLLDGVVFSGGEPTLQAALPDALREVRALGFETALHTGGMYPERLADAAAAAGLGRARHQGAMAAHRRDHGVRATARRACRHRSHHLLASGVAYECRTTWHPGLFGVDELRGLADELAALGVRHWALQECRMPGWRALALAPEHAQALSAQFEQFTLRRA